MQAAVKAITGGKAELDVKIVQLVRLFRGGEPVKMSKRSGEFVTLRDVVDEVGRDPMRFMMVYRKNDAPLDFDFAKVTEQSKDNPVFYVQYAHARTCSVFRQAQSRDAGPRHGPGGARARRRSTRLTDSGEMALIRRLCEYPRIIEGGGRRRTSRTASPSISTTSPRSSTPTGIAARSCRNCDLLTLANPDSTLARLALVHATKLVLSSGLAILGVSAPEEMR